jgi:GNAT superfamily N-acetyltransferase
VVSGRREGHLVGLAVAWMDDSGGHVAVAVQPATRRQGVGGHLLAAVEAAVDRAGWRCARLAAVGPAGFYRARSARARVT